MLADFDFTNPTPGGSSGTWGAELNAILDILKAHPGIRCVADEAARLAIVPFKGQVILQLDHWAFFKCIDAAAPTWEPAASIDGVLTVKGDLLVYGSGLARLGVGTDGQVLTVDAAQALGVKWATPSASPGGGGGAGDKLYLYNNAWGGF